MNGEHDSRIKEVRRAVARLTRRARWTRAVRWSLWGLAAGAAVGLAVVLIAYLWPVLDRAQIFLLALAALMICSLGAGIVGYAWRLNSGRLLVAAELRLGLRSRLSSSLYVLEHSDSASSDLEPALIRDAERCARSVDWRRAVPYIVPRAALGLVALLLAGTFVLNLLPNPQLQTLARNREVARVEKQEANKIGDAADKLRKQVPKQDKEAAKVLQELDKLQQDLKKGDLSREEAAARVSKAESDIQRVNDNGPARDRAALDRLTSALSQNPDTAQLASAISSGDSAEIDKQARKLSKDMKQMSPERRSQAEDTLKQASSSVGELSPELSKALENAASGSPESGQNLSSQLQSASSNAKTAQAIEGTLSQLQTSKSNVANAGTGPTTTASSQQPTGQGTPAGATVGQNANGQGQNGQGQAGQGQNGQGQGGQGQNGQGQGGQGQNGAGQSSGNSNGGNAGQGGGYSNQGRGGSASGQQPGSSQQGTHGNNQGKENFSPPKDVYAPSRTDKNGKLVPVQGRNGSQGSTNPTDISGKGQKNDSTVPYSEAYSEYNDAASSYMDSHYIPITLKGYVSNYFTQIAPQQPSKDNGKPGDNGK